MRRLYLLRHAAAVPKGAATDLERRLSAGGRAEMEVVAAHLARGRAAPDLALVSPSARTRETWTLTRLEAVEARDEEAIYEAAPETLLEVVRRVGEAAPHLMLVGHNPGIEEFGNLLVGPGGPGGFPTATLATLEADIGSWADLSFGEARLAAFESPATMQASPPQG